MKLTSWSRVALTSLAALLYPSFASGQSCAPSTFDGAFADEVTLCQNWETEEQQVFWFLSQGSQILPYDWFLALEQKGSEALFRDAAHMNGFRYLPQRATAMNPDALPIGFSKDNAKGNEAYAEISDKWLGLTCAACHTGQVEFGSHKMLIDGAPTMADFEGFMIALVAAMQATVDDKQKFDRFAARVLGPGGLTSAREAELRRQLESMTEIRHDWNERNKGASPYGFARLDAIGAIFNAVTATALDIPGNRKPADAPVSYPFIWDTPQHDRVQWNGSVENAGIGALGRNVGEVLGVFGSLKLNNRPLSRSGHKTSVNVGHLGRLESLIWKLQSPEWPEMMLPAIDRSAETMRLGREAYERLCLSCHADIQRDDPDRRIQAVLTPVREIGTDPKMAENFVGRRSDSGGRLRGIRDRFTRYWGVLSGFQLYGAEGANAEMLGYSVIGTITREFFRDPAGTIEAIKAGQRAEYVRVLEDAEGDLKDAEEGFSISSSRKAKIRRYLKEISGKLEEPNDDAAASCSVCYKARPLNGIWATAPYLHNGSVRTMRQLLLPARMRQETFRVGSRTFDPVEIGFEDAGGYVFDTSLPGNSNRGHEYGAEEFAADEATLNALLEYLKTL